MSMVKNKKSINTDGWTPSLKLFRGPLRGQAPQSEAGSGE